MESVADRNYAWFKRNRTELADEHPGEYVVIADESAVGVFTTLDEAIEGALAGVCRMMKSTRSIFVR